MNSSSRSDFDVVVIGSGAAGLAAALSARAQGARVLVVERASTVGGTSAMSGGVMWIPGHRFGDGSDTPADGLEYLRNATRGEVDDEPLRAYVDEARGLVQFLEDNTTLRLNARSDHPDYLPEEIGARSGRGVEPAEWDSAALGDAAAIVRRSPSGWRDGLLDVEKRAVRDGVWRAGRALVGALYHACNEAGVEIITKARAVRLERNGTRIDGVWVEVNAKEELIAAKGGVVLASGGFEWDPELVRAFLGVPLTAPVSSPSNTGDGLRMAMQVGARLGNMTQAWWTPSTRVSDAYYEDGPLNRFVTQERSKPGSIVVDASGRRFVRETLNYNDFGHTMTSFDGAFYGYPHIPAFLVFDEQCRRSYTMVGIEPEDPTPEWVRTAETLEDLAVTCGIDADGLRGQVSTFNSRAAYGEDPTHQRGSTAYESYAGDPLQGGNGTIRALGAGPYYAIELSLGALGTKGGPVVDLKSRVLTVDGEPIPGLFAAGNVTASIMGASYPGPGVTLGPAMVAGLRAGRTAAGSSAAAELG